MLNIINKHMPFYIFSREVMLRNISTEFWRGLPAGMFLLCLTVYCGDIVLLPAGVYSSNHRVLYTIGISMTGRFQKSVGPSVCPFITLTKKNYSSFIINSRKIFRISGERAYNPLQENEAIFSKNIFQTF